MRVVRIPSVVGCLALFYGSVAGAAELRCPATLGAKTAVPQSFEKVGSPPGKVRKLASAQIVNGPPGEEQKPAPATLAPDVERDDDGRVEQTWDLSNYRQHGLLLVCVYDSAYSYLRAVLPDAYSTCTVRPMEKRKAAEAFCR